MTTSTYSPTLLQSPYGQAGFYGQQGTPGFDQGSPFQQFAAPYGQQGIEQQLIPAVQQIMQQLASAQQCVWTAQHLLAQVTQALPVSQFGQFGQFGQLGQFGQRQLPRQYPMGW